MKYPSSMEQLENRGIAGDIVECGVLKGSRAAVDEYFTNLTKNIWKRPISK
jgi:hypothetical protein